MGTWVQHYGYLGSRAQEYFAALADLSQLQLQDEVEKTWNTKDTMDARVQDFQPLHYRKVSIWEVEHLHFIENFQLCLSFYPHPNISDRFVNLASHFIRVQIFQIHLWGTK